MGRRSEFFRFFFVFFVVLLILVLVLGVGSFVKYSTLLAQTTHPYSLMSQDQKKEFPVDFPKRRETMRGEEIGQERREEREPGMLQC